MFFLIAHVPRVGKISEYMFKLSALRTCKRRGHPWMDLPKSLDELKKEIWTSKLVLTQSSPSFTTQTRNLN